LDWRWNWIGGLLWNLVVHAVSFQWGSLGSDIDAIKGWFSSFWGAITGYADDVRNWARGQISWLSGYAFGLYVQATNLISSKINDLRSWAQGRISWVSGYAYGLYLQARNWIDSQVSSVRSWAQGLVSGVYAWARPYIDWAVNGVRNLFAWIQPYRDLITNFLVGARSVISWLWHVAWGNLQAFLADPKGWVLRELLGPIVNGINWWKQYGPLLANFAANQLPNLLNLLGVGFGLLMRFVDRPGETILELIGERFIDWFAGLIADNW
jgi:phage-related protein